MHSAGGGKSFSISSSGGNIGFSNNNGGVNAALLVELVDAFDFDLVLLLLLLDDAVAVDSDDDDDEPTVKLLPIDLLLVVATDILLDEVGIGSNIPEEIENSIDSRVFIKNITILNRVCVSPLIKLLTHQVHQQN